LRRIIDLTCNVTHPRSSIRLDSEARSDIKAWATFLENFNGKSVFLFDNWVSSSSLKLYSDAAGKIGYAAVFGSQWFAYKWEIHQESYHITIKELFPIVLAIEYWGFKLQNHKILFFSDNMAVVDILNKQTSREKTVMRLVRRLVITAMKFNIFFKAKHIPGKQNLVADHLSRFQFQAAKNAAPWLDKHPISIPNNSRYI
jgi:hypothetical protein